MPELKIDRTGWPPGPWDDEPEDRMAFSHAGFKCLMVRNHMGGWCGYVGVPPEHPLYEKSDSEADLDVHGGVTYADYGSANVQIGFGAEDQTWWIGFDTAHFRDIVPGMLAFEMKQGWHPHATPGTYKTREWVRCETQSLADQIRSAEPIDDSEENPRWEDIKK
jgi:hypothetical protein